MSGPKTERGGAFPATRWSAIALARSEDMEERGRGWERIASSYWKPLYKYLRLRWNRDADAAADLTQEFFARAVEKDFLAAYDPSKARLRTFLRMCLDRMVQNEDKAGARLKRGGGVPLVPLDVALAERELPSDAPPGDEAMNAFFDTEWMRALFTNAVEQLRAECAGSGRGMHFALFEAHDLRDADPSDMPSYETLAREHGCSVSDVTNRLHWARRTFRRIVLTHLREMCASEEEFRAEARSLFGVRAP